MIKSPCSREENHVRIDCERRCVGCRKDCPDWEEYMIKVEAEREQKKISRILGEMQRDRCVKKSGNSMERLVKKLYGNHN